MDDMARQPGQVLSRDRLLVATFRDRPGPRAALDRRPRQPPAPQARRPGPRGTATRHGRPCPARKPAGDRQGAAGWAGAPAPRPASPRASRARWRATAPPTRRAAMPGLRPRRQRHRRLPRPLHPARSRPRRAGPRRPVPRPRLAQRHRTAAPRARPLPHAMSDANGSTLQRHTGMRRTAPGHPADHLHRLDMVDGTDEALARPGRRRADAAEIVSLDLGPLSFASPRCDGRQAAASCRSRPCRAVAADRRGCAAPIRRGGGLDGGPRPAAHLLRREGAAVRRPATGTCDDATRDQFRVPFRHPALPGADRRARHPPPPRLRVPQAPGAALRARGDRSGPPPRRRSAALPALPGTGSEPVCAACTTATHGSSPIRANAMRALVAKRPEAGVIPAGIRKDVPDLFSIAPPAPPRRTRALALRILSLAARKPRRSQNPAAIARDPAETAKRTVRAPAGTAARTLPARRPLRQEETREMAGSD